MVSSVRLDYLKDRHLRLLVALAEERQLGRAADRIGISQPAASKALTEIEDRVGARLFDRGPHETLPNEAGRIVVGYAIHCLGETRRVAEELHALGHRNLRVLRVGMLASMAATFVPSAVSILLRDHPNFDVSLDEGVLGALIDKLRKSEIDLLVGRIDRRAGGQQQAAGGEFEEVYLADEPLMIVCRVGHPMLRLETVRLEDIYACAWILPLRQTLMREKVDQIFGVAPLNSAVPPIESNSPIATLALLERSDRLAIMSVGMANRWREAGLLAIVPVEIDFHPGAMGVVYRRNDAHLPGVALFVNALRTCLGAGREKTR